MRRILFCVLLGITASASLIRAQDADTVIASLSDLSHRGQLSQLIQAADSFLANDKLTPDDRGIVLTYLGHAYQKRGEFTKATSNYEKALAIINSDGQHPSDYAATLATLATLYVDTGQTDAAKHVLLRSLRLFENENDHAGAALIWNDLATMAAEQRSHGEARKYMARAIAESHLAPNITQDVLVALATTQARIAEVDGDAQTAISGYQHALTLWKQAHDDRHTDTGWLYVLLGGAYLEARDIANAREMTSHGLTLLEACGGRQTPRYFAAEIAYSKVLDASGAHDEASTLRAEAEAGLHTSPARRQAQGEISISALR
jgi:tetratricopeptide (TPR) repeat protein